MNQTVNEWINLHKEALIEDIKKLCAINSVQGDKEEGKPFGEGPYLALKQAMDFAKKYGLDVKNYDNYVGTADYDTSLPRSLDILCHTDVVPAGEGWKVTDPFKVIEKDGCLYGRGTSDDKGPLMAAMYAMRALKECGVKLKKGVRLIMGTNEETGSEDIAYYYKREPEAEMTFSPDGEFPVINIEKGRFCGKLSKVFLEDDNLPKLVSFKSGSAVNAVPGKAVIRLKGWDSKKDEHIIQEVAKECEVNISVAGEEEITIFGKAAHASTPQDGRNAGLAAVVLISKLSLYESGPVKSIKEVLRLFPYGVTDGSGIGIKMEDDKSHDLTCTLNTYKVTSTCAEFTFDARTPIIATKTNCEDVAEAAAKAAGFDWSTLAVTPPHIVSEDSDFVKKLLASYEKVTGKKGKCLSIGGGTYVHDLKRGVAFGAIFEGVDTKMHGADEFFPIDNLMTAAKIYADAIIRLCG